MQITKTAEKTYLTMSRREWEEMGKTAGFGFKGIFDKVKEALEPDKTNPYIDKSEHMRDDNGAYNLTNVMSEQEVLQVTGDKVNLAELENDLKKKVPANSTDTFFLLTIPKAIEYIHERNGTNKNAVPLKMYLYRFVHLSPALQQWKMAVAVIKKWYEERMKNEISMEKPKNPYIPGRI